MKKPPAVLVKHPDPDAIESTGLALVIERLAINPTVDVSKLEQIILLQERVEAINARKAFNVAFANMQADIPTIGEDGHTDKTSYATLENIIDVVRPILRTHGFALNFRTEWPDKQTVKVVGILTHREGHAQESEFLSEADQSGSKNAIQALGSAVSYGRRYTVRDLLNIVTRGQDDDGQRANQRRQAPPKRREGPRDPEIAPRAAAPVHPVQRSGATSSNGAVISDKQRQRLWVILKHAGRDQAEFKSWLWQRYKLDSTKKIKRDDYDEIVAFAESQAPLIAREPGMEG
jgi:hypothetical protein